jgi:hypothetical protein
MSLRNRIEKAKSEGTQTRVDADAAEKSYESERARLARQKAQLEAREILESLPNRVREHAEQGKGTRFGIMDVGSVSSVVELKNNPEHAGHYVLKALEADGYTPQISIDCSGAWDTHNYLECEF